MLHFDSLRDCPPPAEHTVQYAIDDQNYQIAVATLTYYSTPASGSSHECMALGRWHRLAWPRTPGQRTALLQRVVGPGVLLERRRAVDGVGVHYYDRIGTHAVHPQRLRPRGANISSSRILPIGCLS